MPYKNPIDEKAWRLRTRNKRNARRRKVGYDKRYHKNILNHRRNTINSIKDQLGGKCKICGYNKNYSALIFHHPNPSDKEFNIARMYTSKYIDVGIVMLEILKCDLVCANCHAEIHNPHQQRSTT